MKSVHIKSDCSDVELSSSDLSGPPCESIGVNNYKSEMLCSSDSVFPDKFPGVPDDFKGVKSR